MDTSVDVNAKSPESGDYKYAVYAYIVRTVNRLGVESGPSPYALTIPSSPAWFGWSYKGFFDGPWHQ